MDRLNYQTDLCLTLLETLKIGALAMRLFYDFYACYIQSFSYNISQSFMLHGLLGPLTIFFHHEIGIHVK